MKYENTLTGKFLRRLNRFVAEVEIEGKPEFCHVKNTGRLKELLLPGAEVILTDCGAEHRKTRCDLISVYRSDGALVNIDSLAPNRIAAEHIKTLFPDITHVKREYPFGESRLDLYAEREGQKPLLIEVKGVTLLKNGAACFPDAPTERGIKHIRELMGALDKGFDACILFVVQMRGAKCLSPNDETHPAFGEALREAARKGVQLRCVECDVRVGEVTVHGELPVVL